ncbi:MAG: SDR family oxidoreductase [Anaerolineales bacterium]|uniref:SDR family oxidoreductase n=1 Tax=Candidatus Villigracilis vicinus TaxID=3140679 RepID=UPI003135BA67|nr:SDR family oxidoreductase [Anaerolineales bacterium]
MKDKVVLITGATSGIGKQTALALAKMGARVVVTGRSKQSGEEAVAEIKAASGNANVELLIGDLSAQKNVHVLAEQFKARYDRLDVLINNAGLASSKRELTVDGIESNFAVNVVTPFLLTHLLMDSLKASSSPRVVTLMGGDVPAKLDMDNLQSEKSFDGLNTYSQTKLAMMVLMYEFAQREKDVTINVCYPGQASTNMTRSVTPEMLPGFMRFAFPLFKLMVREDGGKSAAKASRSSIYLASSPEVEGVTGKYLDTNCKEAAWSPAVLDGNSRDQLWSMVEQLTQLKS